MWYILLRGHWCDIIFLNVHAPTKDKIDDMKDSFYEDKYHKYHMKIFLENFIVKVGREDFLKPTIWNESLHEINNDNGVRIVNFATFKNLIVKSTVFPHHNIHIFTLKSRDGGIHECTDGNTHQILEPKKLKYSSFYQYF
jgi:hypothetical protein